MRTGRYIPKDKALAMTCAVLFSLLLFVGCSKEDGKMRFSIFTERYGGGVKVVVDGPATTWRAGDEIWVNGVTGTVSLDSVNRPVLVANVDNWGGGYYAAYPASTVAGCTNDGTLSLTLPQEYQYREDASGHQLLEMPLVAYTVNDRLTFKHLTGALIVRVPYAANNANNMVLDYIMVKSSTSPLSGSGTVDMTAETPQVTFGNDTTHTVVMYFDRTPVSIPSNATTAKDIMIPVAPTAGDNHKFTVTVCAHAANNSNGFFIFNQESTSGNLSRNELAYAPVPALTPNAVPFLGSGEPADPYLIQNKKDYKNFLSRIASNNGNDKWYTLVNNIDFGGETLDAVTSQYGFYGKFDGNGKRLSNVSVRGKTYYQYPDYLHFISLFPAMTGGWVKDLTVSDVRLIIPTSGSFYKIYMGGFSSYVKAFGDGVSLQNIHASRISMVGSLKNQTVSSTVTMGGVVGALVESGTNGFATMTSCEFQQTSVTTFSDSVVRSEFCFGGLIGDVAGPDITLTDCSVRLGGNQNSVGTWVKTSCQHSYVGAAIGRTSSNSSYNNSLNTRNTIQIIDTLLLEGHFQFMGTPNKYVKRIIGSKSTSTNVSVSEQTHVNTNNLFVWKQSDSVTVDY